MFLIFKLVICVDYLQGYMSQQEQEELSFEDDSIVCDSIDNPEVIDATADLQLGVRYVHIVHVHKR